MTKLRVEPRWPSILNTLAIIALFLLLPERLSPGPYWLFPSLILLLLIVAVMTYRLGRVELNFIVGVMLLAVTTLVEIWALAFLITGLPDKRQPAEDLLRSAAVLWVSNILVFASWYWRLDAGGPHRRDLRNSHSEGAFLFPQMTLPESSPLSARNWKPGFVDYLFLAFNTSTAFSPTDVPVLSRWAKGAMMIQAIISLGTIAIIAARGINLL